MQEIKRQICKKVKGKHIRYITGIGVRTHKGEKWESGCILYEAMQGSKRVREVNSITVIN